MFVPGSRPAEFFVLIGVFLLGVEVVPDDLEIPDEIQTQDQTCP